MDRTEAPDAAERATVLLRDVASSAEDARRYRALATRIAEPALDRALAIGSVIRRELRTGPSPRPAVAAALSELQELLDACRSAIAEVRSSRDYVEAASGFARGDTERVASLAPAIFAGVVPAEGCATVFWPVPIAARIPGSHFVPAEKCAAHILALSNEGIPAALPPPDLGADDLIGAVPLSEEHDGADSPIALAFNADELPAPVCRLQDTPTLLFYAPRLRCEFAIHAAGTVSDEWWAVRPDAYRRYLDELRHALGALASRLQFER